MRHLALLLGSALALATSLEAQWSIDPATNLLAVDRVGEQTQPKLAATSDGGFYLSWFDNHPGGSPAFGYDVYLQRFGASGVEQWAHNGVLVADLGLSSTTDYDLAVDSAGNALLTFQDDRPTGTQITAARVDPSGTLLWGSAGVQLTSTTDFVANPKIVGTTDGEIVVAWVQNATVRVQRLDGSGAMQWSPDLVLTPATGSYSTGDMDATDGGSCILSLVHQTGGFGSPRHILAQKLDPAGGFLWISSHVAVFDGGSLQLGNFPQFVEDGSGGAVFAWYSSSPSLQCFAQRVDASGTELFPHNGTSVGTSASLLRVAPDVTYDAGSQSTYVSWVQKNSTQSQCGVGAQKLDATGNRQWGTDGKTLVGLGAASISDVRTLFLGSTIATTWTSSPSFGQDVARTTLLDAAGSTVVPTFEFSSTPSVKFRFVAERSANGFGVLAWRDERGTDPDIYLQALYPNGSLGGEPSTALRNGYGVNVVCYTSLSEATLGDPWMTQVSHAHHPGIVRTIVVGHSGAFDGPILARNGVVVGQLLVGGQRLFADSVPSTGSADLHSMVIPNMVGLVGTTMATQAVLVGGRLEFGNALDVTIGL